MNRDKRYKQKDASASSTPCQQSEAVDRRQFLASAAVAAFAIVPRQVLGGAKYVAPSERINVGYIGVGTQGIRQLMDALRRPELKIVSVCDPNTDSNDYVEWSTNEIRNKIRAFLNKPTWGEGLQGCRCGRQVGREIVESYYAMATAQGAYKGCSAYSDFRELLENQNDLDAVYVMTPDHLHAMIAIAAMRKGKHVIMHKPLSNVLYEARLAADTARETKLATHMFCAASAKTTPLLCEWIWDGAIGHVREVHNWSSRPFWPQGMTDYPREEPPVPEGLDWDLWLGPVPHRPYHPAYTHAVFRGWYDFGAGPLGDMGSYSFYQIFKILKLTSPTAAEASRSQYWAIVDNLWKKQENKVSFPRASMIHFEFPARRAAAGSAQTSEDMPPVSLYWYDGGLRPPTPKELELDQEDMPGEGLLFVGDKGKILAGFSGDNPRLIPQEKMRAYKKPRRAAAGSAQTSETLPRPIDELDQWIRACKGGDYSDASFERVRPFAETICLGAIALRLDRKLKWDAENMRVTNVPEANHLLRRKYRKGWEL